MIFHIALLFAWTAAAHDSCHTKALSMVQTKSVVSKMEMLEGEGLLLKTADLAVVATRSSYERAHNLFVQHSSRSAQIQKANEEAAKVLQAVKEKEKNFLAHVSTENLTTPNLTAHYENKAAHYRQKFLDANATKCRECGNAEEALILATQAALAAHTKAQAAAAFLGQAAKNYAVAAQGFGVANKEYTQVADQMCPITLTYNAAESAFDFIASSAQGLKQKALIAQQHKVWEKANKTVVDTAQSQYDVAAARATAAEQPIAAREATAAAACASIVAPPAGPVKLKPVAGCPGGTSCDSWFSAGCGRVGSSNSCLDSNEYSPFVTVLPRAERSSGRWWTGGGCSRGKCTNLWMVVDLGAAAVISRIKFINYHDKYGVKKLRVSAAPVLTGPYVTAQVFSNLPSTLAGYTGKTTGNHFKTVPDTDLVFNPAVLGRFFKFEVLENHGSTGTGFYRIFFTQKGE